MDRTAVATSSTYHCAIKTHTHREPLCAWRFYNHLNKKRLFIHPVFLPVSGQCWCSLAIWCNILKLRSMITHIITVMHQKSHGTSQRYFKRFRKNINMPFKFFSPCYCIPDESYFSVNYISGKFSSFRWTSLN